MKSRTSSTGENTNIVKGKISCGECGVIMHQKVNPNARVNLFVCKNKSCGNSVNRPWLFKMVRLAVEEHVNKGDIDNQLYEKKVNLLNSKIKEAEKKTSKKKGAIIRTLRMQNGIIDSIGLDEFNDIVEGLKKDYKTSNTDLTDLKNDLQTTKEGYIKRKKKFSKQLKEFKMEIEDILHSVTINQHKAVINIFGWRLYDIPKPNIAHLKWNTREKNKGGLNKFDIYHLPTCRYDTGDEDLDMLIHHAVNPNYEDELDEYLKSDEHQQKNKGVGSLGNRK